MKQDEIIEMAVQAGANKMVSCLTAPNGPITAINFDLDNGSLEAFAKLVAAKEREACAKVCDDIDAECEGEAVSATWCSKAIRARGKA